MFSFVVLLFCFGFYVIFVTDPRPEHSHNVKFMSNFNYSPITNFYLLLLLKRENLPGIVSLWPQGDFEFVNLYWVHATMPRNLFLF